MNPYSHTTDSSHTSLTTTPNSLFAYSPSRTTKLLCDNAMNVYDKCLLGVSPAEFSAWTTRGVVEINTDLTSTAYTTTTTNNIPLSDDSLIDSIPTLKPFDPDASDASDSESSDSKSSDGPPALDKRGVDDKKKFALDKKGARGPDEERNRKKKKDTKKKDTKNKRAGGSGGGEAKVRKEARKFVSILLA